MTRRLAAKIALVALLCSPIAAQKLQYPNTTRVDQVDTYFGEGVADPYRWLEDDNAPETAKWVEDQNKVTFGYLDQIPYRAAVRARIEQLYNYPRYGAPFRRGEYFFFSKNDGLQNQSVYYTQKGLDGTPSVLIDPNTFAIDGTSQLGGFALSRDGKYLTRVRAALAPVAACQLASVSIHASAHHRSQGRVGARDDSLSWVS